MSAILDEDLTEVFAYSIRHIHSTAALNGETAALATAFHMLGTWLEDQSRNSPGRRIRTLEDARGLARLFSQAVDEGLVCTECRDGIPDCGVLATPGPIA